MSKKMRAIGDRYRIAIEQAKGNYSAYSPDLPGRVAMGTTSQV